MHANQVETSSRLVRCLLAEQYPSLAEASISDPPLHGTDSDTYRVGANHAVRLPIIDWAVGKQEHIRHWLPWLDSRLSIPVPVPIWYGTPTCGYPHNWTIYPWVVGQVRDFGEDDPQIARDVAAFLRELRSLPIENAPSSGRSPHELDDDVRKSLEQLTEGEHQQELIVVWNEMMSSEGWDGTGAVWMHGDVAPGNLLFRDGVFVGAIDWTELGVGDPAHDLQVAWNFFAPTARQIFRQEIAVGDAIWFRVRARAFAQAAFQLPYYRDSYPLLAAQARYVFTQILDEYK